MAGKKVVVKVAVPPVPMCSVCSFRGATTSGRCAVCREERDRIMAKVLAAMIMHGTHHQEEQVVRNAYRWADVCMRVGRE